MPIENILKKILFFKINDKKIKKLKKKSFAINLQKLQGFNKLFSAIRIKINTSFYT